MHSYCLGNATNYPALDRQTGVIDGLSANFLAPTGGSRARVQRLGRKAEVPAGKAARARGKARIFGRQLSRSGPAARIFRAALAGRESSARAEKKPAALERLPVEGARAARDTDYRNSRESARAPARVIGSGVRLNLPRRLARR